MDPLKPEKYVRQKSNKEIFETAYENSTPAKKEHIDKLRALAIKAKGKGLKKISQLQRELRIDFITAVKVNQFLTLGLL